MNSYTIRIDVIEDYSLDATLEMLEKAVDRFDKFLIALEVADKTKKLHFQGVIYTDLEMKTYRTYMERKFSAWASHKGSRSFAVMKKIEYLTYICKDGDIRLRKGFSDDDIVELKKKSFKKSEGSKDPKKPWFDTLYDSCIEHGITIHSDGWEIAKVIIRCYNDFVKCEPNDFQIRCYAKSIQRRLVFAQASPEQIESYLRRRADVIIGHEWVSSIYC